MFVKKDTRKVPDILTDEKDEREEMQLGRRSSEFETNGVQMLCGPKAAPRLKKLQRMSLYDNMLNNVKGIGAMSSTPLRHLNLGRNQLKSLPAELGQVATLESLWVDDNAILVFPQSVLQLRRLRQLRLSGNRISEIPEEICVLTKLQVLALDNNDLRSVPATVGNLSELQTLLLRQNELERLPDEIGQLLALRNLGISSNRLTSLPPSLGNLTLLETLFANGNLLTSIPPELANLVRLKKANFSNNFIKSLPEVVEAAWGKAEPSTGKLDPSLVGSSRDVDILIRGNKLTEVKDSKELRHLHT